MRFGLFGSAQAERGGPELDSGVGFREFVEYNIEAEARFQEGLDLLLKSWTSQERFDFHGKYWTFNDIVVEPPSHAKPHPQVWMGGSTDESIKQVAARGFNLLLDQYPSLEETAPRVALFKREVEAHGRKFDPMMVGLARAYHVASSEEDKQAALKRRLDGRMRQMELARRPGAPNTGWRFRPMEEQIAINAESALYGSPDEIFVKLEKIREIGVGYVLLNSGGSGGGERALTTLRRFAREIMPHMSDKPALRIAG
jgi:alkanesulfonate monooxygenase SsuD/methylene tetrahydromethanopterin reductase-like flavin-dependent oxidoreductase (luciferase family)